MEAAEFKKELDKYLDSLPEDLQADYGIWNSDEDHRGLDWNQNANLRIPGPTTTLQLDGVSRSGDGQKKVCIADFKGKFLVLVFYKGEGSKAFLQAFSDLADLFGSNNTEICACSVDSSSIQSSWLTGAWAGSCRLALWSDPKGEFSNKFDLWDDQGFCREGIVIIDDAGLVRHAMISSMEPKDAAKNTLEMVASLRKCKVDDKEMKMAMGTAKPAVSSGGRGVSPVRLDRDAMEADWDISTDPDLIKVLNKARMLGKAKPLKMPVLSKNPCFDLSPDFIRSHVTNPKKGVPVRWCTATLHRNLTGFGPSGDIPKDQKIKLENLIKKVMGVAYMPEDLTGKYTSLSTMNQREQTKFLESDLFAMTGDSWMKEPGSVDWSQGKGVFVNNYNNFVLWVGLDDQLRFVSLAKGADLKYVLLRLQKAVTRIEEALKMVFSTKSCNERGFTTSNGDFTHSKKGVYGTGFETTFTIDLPGFNKADKTELAKAENELFLDIEKGKTGSLFRATLRQSLDYTEQDIVERGVESIDNLYLTDRDLQSKLGIKIDPTGRSL